MESDTELQRCGGCGKRFDRKAALSAHLQYCHRRVAAYESSTTKVKKINKVSSNSVPNENIVVNSESNNATQIDNTNVTSIRVEAIGSLSKTDWDMLSSEKSNGNVLMNGEQKKKFYII